MISERRARHERKEGCGGRGGGYVIFFFVFSAPCVHENVSLACTSVLFARRHS